MKKKAKRTPPLATAWAIVCDQTGLMHHTASQVPILYPDKKVAEQEIRNSGDRCDVAVFVEIRSAKEAR